VAIHSPLGAVANARGGGVGWHPTRALDLPRACQSIWGGWMGCVRACSSSMATRLPCPLGGTQRLRLGAANNQAEHAHPIWPGLAGPIKAWPERMGSKGSVLVLRWPKQPLHMRL